MFEQTWHSISSLQESPSMRSVDCHGHIMHVDCKSSRTSHHVLMGRAELSRWLCWWSSDGPQDVRIHGGHQSGGKLAQFLQDSNIFLSCETSLLAQINHKPCLSMWSLPTFFFFLPKGGNEASGRCTKFVRWHHVSQVGVAQPYINQADLSEILHAESWPPNLSTNYFIFMEQLLSSAR